ncbi:ATP-dependent helicase [uncultured Aquimarina sp.]|uniref:ATP-dependent helicase n=1 Tax=uncultured Aquimarina sp. TaxID=575652 RepID=UPI002638A536|nr:ATP-dependent helicase [uncultured Aquimarina sp.]
MNELEQIKVHIEAGDNFLLSGGAGSGKTYTLVQVIKYIIEKYPSEKIACMTYTNAAVKEIEERVNHKNLNVTTIHDFLWDSIKHFQLELKQSLIILANDDEVTRIKILDEVIPDNYFDDVDIQYKEYLRLSDGILSHDELLILAHHIFSIYPKLSSIIKDKFKFILIDEYQDTGKLVIDIFLEQLKLSKKKNVISFFGDSMQSIYDDGIGNLDDYKGSGVGQVKEVKKEQNRRNPKLVIELANRLRTDGLIQTHSNDPKAPNMDKDGNLKNGVVKFLYSTTNNLAKAKDNLGWDFKDSKNVKELNLTHNLIAEKANFRGLMDIYDNDPIIGLKTSITQKIKDNKKYNKPEIKILDTDTFDNVVDKFQLKNRQRQLKKDVILSDPDNAKLYDQLKNIPFSEVRKIYLSKDSLIDDKKQNSEEENKKGSKRDNLIKHLFKIENNISLYKNNQFNDFLRITDYRFKIKINEDKRVLKKKIESLIITGNQTIEEIIIKADKNEICLMDDSLKKFIKEKEYIYNRVKNLKYSEFQSLYRYLEGFTPFSTQHKTKGAEFDNVLVILDNGNWNDYNFQYLLDDSIYNTLTTKKKESHSRILPRTQKIFYVCCTRAKEKLAVYYDNPSAKVVEKATEWFGLENVINLDS